MKHQTSRLNQHAQEHGQQRQIAAGETQGIEFASAEEALRCDAAQTAVPLRVAERLRESIRREPRPMVAPWWQRLVGH